MLFGRQWKYLINDNIRCHNDTKGHRLALVDACCLTLCQRRTTKLTESAQKIHSCIWKRGKTKTVKENVAEISLRIAQISYRKLRRQTSTFLFNEKRFSLHPNKVLLFSSKRIRSFRHFCFPDQCCFLLHFGFSIRGLSFFRYSFNLSLSKSLCFFSCAFSHKPNRFLFRLDKRKVDYFVCSFLGYMNFDMIYIPE